MATNSALEEYEINCGRCKSQLSPSKPRAKCSVCKIEYHLNKACSGVLKESWKTKTDEGRNSWRCVTCREMSRSQVAEKVDQFESRNDSSRSSKRLRTDFDNSLDNGVVSNTSVENLNINNIIEAAVKKVAEQFTQTIDEKLDIKLKQHLEPLSHEQESIKRDIQELKEENEYIRWNQDSSEQYSRRNNVVFSGIPRVNGERPIDTLKRICNAFEYDLDLSQIDDCHRLPTKQKEGEGVGNEEE